MGCAESLDTSKRRDTSSNLLSQLFNGSSTEMPMNHFLLNPIKRKDLILLEKALKRSDSLSLVKKTNQMINRKTILHYLAENNFHEGMSLALEYILQTHRNDAYEIVNTMDHEDNTPILACCLHSSWETFKVMLKHTKLINLKARNKAGRSAYDLALEEESLDVDQLISTSIMTTRESSMTQLDDSKKSIADSECNWKKTPTTLKSLTTLSQNKAKAQAETKLSCTLNDLKKRFRNFVDSEFPHDIYSLANDGSLIDGSPGVKWIRATSLLSNFIEIKVFADIAVNNSPASLLSNCDLYFALAAMTEFPQRLVKIFTLDEVHSEGAYSVNFLVSGIPIEIVLDDYLPCDENSQLIFSRPSKNELWFMLLEKAFAKLYGSYAQVRNVSVCEALEVMTGMPTVQYPLRDVKQHKLWKDMLRYDQNNYIVCGRRKEKYSTLSRILTIAGVYEINKNRIIKIINHFVGPNWNANLAKTSWKWDQKMKSQTGHPENEKNSIYLDLEEFLEVFDSLYVCHYHDTWTRSGLEIKAAPGKANFLKFDIEQEMDVIISAHQRNPIFMDAEFDCNLSPIEIILAEETQEGNLRSIAFGDENAFLGKQTVFASENTSIKLSKGTYVLRIKAYWTDAISHELAVNIFSPHCVNIKSVGKESYPNFKSNLCLNIGNNFLRKFRFNNGCQFGSAWTGSHLWIVANNEGKKTWKLKIIFDKMTNLKLCKDYKREEDTMDLVLQPGDKISTYAKRIDCGEVGLNWKFEQSWE